MNGTGDGPTNTETEHHLRRRLGIPDSAEKVLVLAESSHWDPNWLLRSDQYFRWMVRRNLDRAVAELVHEPRRVYGVECTFFPQMYWDAASEPRREIFRDLVNAGRLRFTASGVTTPDTLIPREETILRDFLLGQEWLREHGMHQEPKLSYFPDSFGHSPGLPALLNAAGFDMAAVTRVDGMLLQGAEWAPPGHFPRPGSTASLLLQDEKSLDFVWTTPCGAELLTHWNAFGYGHGDMIAAHGPVRLLTLPTYIPDRREAFVRHRIERYVRELAPVSRTPYMLLAMGLDFVPPVPRLWELIDRWNETEFDRRGIWLTNAGYDDYLSLVSHHRHSLPAVDLDSNPYWTGFYSARLDLKRACVELAETLVLAEAAAATRPGTGYHSTRRVQAALAPAWHVAVTSDHHDWITGTSPDRVARGEQLPWLDRARREVTRILERELADLGDGCAVENAQETNKPRIRCTESGSRIEIETESLRAVVDAARGGCVVELEDADSGVAWADGPGADVVVFEDSGGLWRMGMEFAGGRFREIAAASSTRAHLEVDDCDGTLLVTATCEVAGRRTLRRFRFDGSSALRVTTDLGCEDGHAAVLRFPTSLRPERIRMHQPGAVVDRPLSRLYEPTFWALHSFAATLDREGRGIGIASDMPTALHASGDGRVEIIVARNATKETAWGFLPLLAHPARGHVRDDIRSDVALWFLHDADAARPRELAREWNRLIEASDGDRLRQVARSVAGSAFEVDRPSTTVTAKLAHRGHGVIIRLREFDETEAVVRLRSRSVAFKEARLCDVRERDLGVLPVTDGSVQVPLRCGFATVRLLLDEPDAESEPFAHPGDGLENGVGQ
ncbi:MAG: hypothetical protein DYH08_09700 [Actinobacteria bacterium ATB1]|nr:hypothetical protein [Actinobacteria bacterium ATB1]